MRKRIFTALVGFFTLILLFVNLHYYAQQPVANLGFSLEIDDYNFKIGRVNTDLFPKTSTIQNQAQLDSINDKNHDYFLSFRRQNSGQSYTKMCSQFFNFGDTVQIKTSYGTTSFILHKLGFWDCIKSSSLYTRIQLLISLFMILSGIAIALLMNPSGISRPLIYSLYFLGLTTAVLFPSDFSALTYSKVITVIMDIGLFFTFSCIFAYISQIFKTVKFKNPFKYLQFVPVLFLFVKYIHIIAYKMDIIENVFYAYYSIIATACSLIYLAIFIYISFTFPKEITVTFKFFVISTSFAILPLLLDHYIFILTNSLIMTEQSRIYSIIAFFFIPFMMWIALFQNKNKVRSASALWITTYVAFAVISLPIFFTAVTVLPKTDQNIVSIIYLLFSPASFILIYLILKRFFSFSSRLNDAKITLFQAKIEPVSELSLLHEYTAEEIYKTLCCTYVVFFKKNSEGNFDPVFNWPVSNNLQTDLAAEISHSKKHIVYYKDGSFYVPLLRDNTIGGVILIGPKQNGDLYLPGEPVYIEQVLQAFHKHYLLLTNNKLFNELKVKNAKVQTIQRNTILSMANLIESRDGGTGEHVKRTAEYSLLISKKAREKKLFTDEIDDNFIHYIYRAAPMHDIGKIVVSDSILKKPDKLTDQEYEEMKKHTTEGERIVKEVFSNSDDKQLFEMTAKIATYHHEKWNGKGYPAGLKENQIPLCARILAIADVFDALVSPRCYKKPMEPEKAFDIIRNDAGIHFDPILAEVFLELKEQALEIMNKETNHE